MLLFRSILLVGNVAGAWRRVLHRLVVARGQLLLLFHRFLVVLLDLLLFLGSGRWALRLRRATEQRHEAKQGCEGGVDKSVCDMATTFHGVVLLNRSGESHGSHT